MRRQISLWMGFVVLFLSLNLCQEGFAKEEYKVKRGDTLYSISKKTGLSIKEIKRINRLSANKLKIGQKLALSSPVKRQEIAMREVANVVDTRKIAATEDESENDGGLSGEDDVAEVEKGEEANMEPLGKWNSPDERKIFVRVVKGFLGAPYRFGGSSIRGLDCSAFVKKIYQFFGINLPRTAREQSYVGKRVPRNELEEGDLVFFNTRRPVGHVGIYMGNNEFIHASFRNKEVRIDSLESPYYDKRFIRAVRVKGLDGKYPDDFISFSNNQNIGVVPHKFLESYWCRNFPLQRLEFKKGGNKNG